MHEDGWKINACPVNGPMLSARGRDVAIAWFTLKEEQGRAFVAFSQDAGRSFGPPFRLDDAGSLGRVDVELMRDGSAVASWIEFADERAQFRVRRVDRSGARSSALTVSSVAGSRASGYPRLASNGDEVVFAWVENADGATQLRTAVTRWGCSENSYSYFTVIHCQELHTRRAQSAPRRAEDDLTHGTSSRRRRISRSSFPPEAHHDACRTSAIQPLRDVARTRRMPRRW